MIGCCSIRRYFLPVAVLCSAAAGLIPNTLHAQVAIPTDRIFILTSENAYQFGTYLFGMDPSIKEHPHHLTGVGTSFALGAALPKSFSLSLEASENRVSGSGHWLDTDHLSPEEAQYLPVATGKTRLRIRGLAFVLKKDFGHLWKFSPYAEAGGGIGTMKLSFMGTVAATDPDDGQSFTVPAFDTVHRNIPIGLMGGGLEIPFSSGFSLQAGYRWEEGSMLSLGMKFFLFRRPE